MQYHTLAKQAQINNVPKAECMGSKVAMVRAIQAARGQEPCFMSAQRLLCPDEECEWRKECRRLVAIWRR